MDVSHVKSNRHFCNKVWQAFKFVSAHLEPGSQHSAACQVRQSALSSQFTNWTFNKTLCIGCFQ